MKVPFNDLRRIHDPLKPELDAAWHDVTSANSYILGPHVEKFEQDFARFNGLPGKGFAAGLSNGTDALELILRALGIGEDKEVITVANTFTATANAIRMVGATPVFVDIDPRTYLMDISQIEGKIKENKTAAILPVHLYGQQADMKSIRSIANKHGLRVIEDACQAHGALQNGNPCGHYGTAAAFSFYPGKNLGAFGDAGAVISHDFTLIDKIKSFRNYGQRKKYHHDVQGFNKRLDGLQAAILNVKLSHLNEWNDSRSRSAGKLIEMLQGVGDMVLPETAPGNAHIYHVFVVQTEKRDELMKHLQEKGIETGIHYPIPLHQQKSFDYLGIPAGSLPVTEKMAPRLLSLPIFPKMTDEEVGYISDSVREFFK